MQKRTRDTTLDDYIKRIDNIITKLDSGALDKYPALTRLLDGKTRKKERRWYLRELLVFIKERLPGVEHNAEPVINKLTGEIEGYKLSTSESKLSEIWGIGETTVRNLSMLFAGTLLMDRQKAQSDKTKRYSKKRNTSSKYNHVMYTYWVDAWRPAQLKVKEARALAWLKAGAPAKLDKPKVITIWGQSVADAICQDNATKTKEQEQFELYFLQAYEAIRERTGQIIVTRAEMLEELNKFVKQLQRHNSYESEQTNFIDKSVEKANVQCSGKNRNDQGCP